MTFLQIQTGRTSPTTRRVSSSHISTREYRSTDRSAISLRHELADLNGLNGRKHSQRSQTLSTVANTLNSARDLSTAVSLGPQCNESARVHEWQFTRTSALRCAA